MEIDLDLSTGEKFLVSAIVAMMDNNVPFTLENVQKVSQLPMPILQRMFIGLIGHGVVGAWGMNISAPIT